MLVNQNTAVQFVHVLTNVTLMQSTSAVKYNLWF